MYADEPDLDGEHRLIDLALAGGPAGRAAFGDLVRANQVWLVRLLFYLLHDMGSAEDVAQEAFVRAHRGLPHFRRDSLFRGWLRRIATRLAFNHRRDATTRANYELKVERSQLMPPPGRAVEAHDALLKVLVAVPYPYREILLLRFVEELSVLEIASALDIGESAVKMRLSRARAAFGEHYSEMVMPCVKSGTWG